VKVWVRLRLYYDIRNGEVDVGVELEEEEEVERRR
jgi:hypothetical protein